jgi:hypothetical protein
MANLGNMPFFKLAGQNCSGILNLIQRTELAYALHKLIGPVPTTN